MPTKPIKTLYCEFNSYASTSPSASGELRYNISASVSAQEINVDPVTGSTGQFFYTSNDVMVGDWFVDLTTGRSARIDIVVTELSGNKTLTLTDVNNYEYNNSDSNNSAFDNSSGKGIIFSVDSVTGQPLINFFSIRDRTINYNFFYQAIQSKFQVVTPIIVKDTVTLLSNKPIEIPVPTSYQYLGSFSPVETMTGKVYILPDILMPVTSSSFKVECHAISGGNPVISEEIITSKLLKTTNTDITFTKDTVYTFSLVPSGTGISIPVGLAAYITAYIVKS